MYLMGFPTVATNTSESFLYDINEDFSIKKLHAQSINLRQHERGFIFTKHWQIHYILIDLRTTCVLSTGSTIFYYIL